MKQNNLNLGNDENKQAFNNFRNPKVCKVTTINNMKELTVKAAIVNHHTHIQYNEINSTKIVRKYSR